MKDKKIRTFGYTRTGSWKNTRELKFKKLLIRKWSYVTM